ncbi:DUF92 domain-containing protein [Alkalicoccus urumqiensis]|uniref:DUF92 domain-containing protein n=1 Tax=Alkalicoccus urumqiensis TaxID=1548213 RepID=A0A2P6MKA3_ALKUR|nr:DUF92 domain-containing protein [Alkalicoccus urumqiensis]PRO66675.1 hypothetical protein C6I21_01745 [Alkalicoccus urumqiensis]
MTAWLVIGLAAAAAWKLRTLTISGALCAWVTGGLIWSGGGASGFFLLGAFFLSSVLLEMLFSREKKEKSGETRSGAQVAANGGAAACFFGLALLLPEWSQVLYTGAAASLAFAASDTWASTAGRAVGGRPAFIISRSPAPPGRSGGVTKIGTAFGAAGAVFIAASAWMTGVVSSFEWALFTAGAGFTGQVLDAVLGERFQQLFKLEDGTLTEEPPPDTKSIRVKGWRGWSNTTVNAVSSSITGIAAAAVVLLSSLW